MDSRSDVGSIEKQQSKPILLHMRSTEQAKDNEPKYNGKLVSLKLSILTDEKDAVPVAEEPSLVVQQEQLTPSNLKVKERRNR